MPGSAVSLPDGLAGPVELMLARAVETVPLEGALSGGCYYENKFDGYRLSIVRTNSGARLWSRRGVDLTAASTGVACPYAVETVVIGNALVHDRCRARGRANLTWPPS